MFIFYPICGLGNRMRVMDSAYRFCMTNNLPFEVRWEKDSTLNCAFSSLFVPIEHLRETSSYKYFALLCRVARHSALIRFVLQCLKIKIFRANDYDALCAYVSNPQRKSYWRVYVESYSAFYPSEDDFLSEIFQLNTEMQERVDKEIALFDNHTIGVHIRRSDNIESIEKSPVELFEARMSAEIAVESATKFYVASDDNNLKQRLLEEFRGGVILPSGSLSRDSEEGICQALLEMYALSRTCKILGSYYSSFSDMAAKLGKIELETICKQMQ